MENNNVTIHDIAKALKIDASTVSRALNNSARVTPKTKTKILEEAKKLGYRRNLLAANLRKNKTNTIGVIVPRISRHFFSSVIAGIEETAFESSYNVIICQSLEQLERERNLIDTLLANRVDGVLISVSMETTNYNHLQGLKENGTPIIFFDRHCEITGNSNVQIDDFQGAFDATKHLISRGRKIIAHFAGPNELKIYQNRLRGYRSALEKHGIPYRSELVFPSRLMEKDGIEGAKKIIALPIQIDSVFAANDISAIGAMKYFKKKGVKIPQDIAFVGFSNEPASSVIEPSLTTIDQSGFEMGKIAAKLLLKQINSKTDFIPPETIILNASLIKRNSSK